MANTIKTYTVKNYIIAVLTHIVCLFSVLFLYCLCSLKQRRRKITAKLCSSVGISQKHF